MKHTTKTNAILRKGSVFFMHGRRCTVTGINITTQTAKLDFGGQVEQVALNDVRLAYGEYISAKSEPEPIEVKEIDKLEWNEKGEKLDEITDCNEMQFSFLGMDDFLVSVGMDGTAVFERENGEIAQPENYVTKSAKTHSEKTGLTKFFVRVHNGRVYAL